MGMRPRSRKRGRAQPGRQSADVDSAALSGKPAPKRGRGFQRVTSTFANQSRGENRDLQDMATELRRLSSDLGRLNPYRHNPEQILGAKQAISIRLRELSLQLVGGAG